MSRHALEGVDAGGAARRQRAPRLRAARAGPRGAGGFLIAPPPSNQNNKKPPRPPTAPPAPQSSRAMLSFTIAHAAIIGLRYRRRDEEIVFQARPNLRLAGVFAYQGLVPKVWKVDRDEVAIWQGLGLSRSRARKVVRTVGAVEAGFAIATAWIRF